MDKHEHKTMTKTVFKTKPTDLFGKYDSLISTLFDEATLYREKIQEHQEQINTLQKHNEQLHEKLDERDKTIIHLNNILLLAVRSGSNRLAENILKDLSKSTIHYANRKNEEITTVQNVIAKLEQNNTQLKQRIAEVECRDAANDSGSTPTSFQTITQRQIKNKDTGNDDSKDAGNDAPKLGPPAGHKGHALRWNPDKTIDYTLDVCPNCNDSIAEVSEYYKSIIDVDTGNTVSESWCRIHDYLCQNCGIISSKPGSMLDGTTIGKKFLAKIVRLYHSNKSESELIETIHITYEKRFCRSTIRTALDTAKAIIQHMVLIKSQRPSGNQRPQTWIRHAPPLHSTMVRVACGLQ